MFRNHLKTAFRNILRERQYAILKIAGLALGLGTSLVLFLYVSYQLSYDNFHPNVDRTYRVDQTNIWDPEGSNFGSTGPAVSLALVNEYPEIESVLRINTPGGQVVRYTKADKTVVALNEADVLAADSTFFSFFGFTLREGDPRTALQGKNKVVISDKAAKRLFGDEPALGKLIQMGDDRQTVEITGVTEKQPLNAHFDFDYLLSMPSNPAVKTFEWSWVWTQVVTYIRLKPGVDAEAFNTKLAQLPGRYAPATFTRIGLDYNDFMKGKGNWDMFMTPVRDIHLYTADISNRLGPMGDITYVYIFSAVALFILLIAVVNFVNLSTARGTHRAKEVGVKKALGLPRLSLILQFQLEHIIVTFIAMLLGLAVMELLRMFIQPLTGIEIPVAMWDSPVFFAVVLLLPVVIGFFGGLYPAFYLTAFRPAQVLKGRLMSGMRSSKLRNVLVVFQFTISITLLVATFIVYQQLSFFQSKSLGFDHDNLLMLNHAEKLGNQLESFRNEVATYEGVGSASVSFDITSSMEDIFMREGDDMKAPLAQMKIDNHFLETTKVQLAAGRTFDINRPSDKNAVMLNETAVRLFGLTPEQALGEHIIYVGDDIGPREVIGVAKDVHFQSLYDNIAPVIFFDINTTMYGDARIVLIKFNTTDVDGLLKKIESRWNQLADATPFEYEFYDDMLKMRYQQEQRLGALFSVFTVLSITIAIIGLVGLVAYSVEQRKREIGIRKVFGASLTRIYVMMNTQYVRLLLVALVLATPLSWWLMQKWLDTFVFRTTINPWYFALAGVIELVLASACVGYLALRAATLNPASVLKEE